MKKRFLFLGTCCLASVLMSCAPAIPDSVELRQIEIEKISTSVAVVSKADIFLDDGGLVVSGILRRMHEVKAPGHVDIVICSPDGTIEQKSVAVPGLSSKRRGAMNLPFRTHFPSVPPAGSKIVLRYHPTPLDPLEGFYCSRRS